MTEHTCENNLSLIKKQAKRLRLQHPDSTHGWCLDAVSKAYGFRDWNDASAAIKSGFQLPGPLPPLM